MGRHLTSIFAAAALLACFGFVGAEEKKDDYDDEKRKENSDDTFISKRERTGVTKEEAAAIKTAIDTGAAWLLSQQSDDGSFSGFDENHTVGGQALCMLTLAKCGADRESKAFKRGHDRLYQAYRDAYFDKGKLNDNRQTYASGLILLYLEAIGTPQVAEEKEDQKPQGKDSKRKPRPIPKPKLDRKNQSWAREVANHLIRTQHDKTGVWGYPSTNAYGQPDDKPDNKSAANRVGRDVFGDLSNTQYAMLGLIAASRLGVGLRDHESLEALMKFLIQTQDATGPEVERIGVEVEDNPGRTGVFRKTSIKDKARGWGYVGWGEHLDRPDDAVDRRGSIVTAGLAILIIGKSELNRLGKLPQRSELRAQIDTSIWDGLAWLTHTFTVDHNPKATKNAAKVASAGSHWHYYYLYGLERVGMLAGVDFLGMNEWYPEGARYLLKQQRDDKSWCGRVGVNDVVPADQAEAHKHDTCFALLFLKRATVPISVENQPVVTGRKEGSEK